MDVKTMSDAELQLADATARAAMAAAHAALKLAQATGATPLDCAEWQAMRAAQEAHDPIGNEVYRRDAERRMRLLEPLLREPLTGPEWDEAWERGPGREAL
jgi:hypothetical protein